MRENHKVSVANAGSIFKLIDQHCTELERGIRMMDATITNIILPNIGREFLSRLSSGSEVKRVHLSAKDVSFAYAFD